ncbi:unnamed protein product [Leptosia nina]|uniref:Methyl-accepting transducer domain-containing protein n=1 Tax=Leptosia nina TaxID=320188 RepID=A0AAV1IXU7_9NEOP
MSKRRCLLVLLLSHSVFCDDCHTYDFEKDFEITFHQNQSMCEGRVMWQIGDYSDFNITSPHELSTQFAYPGKSLSCVSSISYPMEGNGVFEVTGYLEPEGGVELLVLVNEIVPNGPDAAVGNIWFTAKGWDTRNVTLTGRGKYQGYITMLGMAASDSMVLVDSFRYIPPDYEEECNIYEYPPTTPGDTTSTTDEVTSTTDEITSTTDEVTSTTDEITSTTDEITSTTDEVTSTTDEITSTTDEVTSTTDEVTSTTDEVTSTTDEVTSTTDEVTSTTDEVTSTTGEVTSTTDEVTSTTDEVTSTTDEVTSTIDEVTSTTDEVTSTIDEVTSTTDEMTSTTDVVTSTTDEITSTTDEDTTTTEFTTPNTESPNTGEGGTDYDNPSTPQPTEPTQGVKRGNQKEPIVLVAPDIDDLPKSIVIPRVDKISNNSFIPYLA